MTIIELLGGLENSAVGTAVRESAVIFPWLETAHVVAVTFVLGSIAVVDLRLMGIFSKDEAVTALEKDIVQWTWGAFGLALLTGLLMFTGTASKYFSNPPFQLKMLLIFAAGINMCIFQFATYRTVDAWDRMLPPPVSARLAGVVSLVLWIAVVAIGRYIGFTLN